MARFQAAAGRQLAEAEAGLRAALADAAALAAFAADLDAAHEENAAADAKARRNPGAG